MRWSRTPRRWRRARPAATPAARQASSRVWVPTTLVRTNSAPDSTERSTCDSAAKCTTASWPGSRSRSSVRSQMSPADEVQTRVGGGKVVAVAGIGELVQYGDPGVLVARVSAVQQGADVVRADEAGAAGDQDPHARHLDPGVVADQQPVCRSRIVAALHSGRAPDQRAVQAGHAQDRGTVEHDGVAQARCHAARSRGRWPVRADVAVLDEGVRADDRRPLDPGPHHAGPQLDDDGADQFAASRPRRRRCRDSGRRGVVRLHSRTSSTRPVSFQ